MRHWRQATFGTLLPAVVIAMMVLPPVAAQTPSPQPAGQTVQETVATNAQGNTVVTERTIVNGRVVKEEVSVTSPQGHLLSKAETTFDPATGQAVKRETVTVTGGTVTKVEQTLVNGQVVKREETVTSVANGRQVVVEREFRQVGGALVQVKEEREERQLNKDEVEKVEKQENEPRDAADNDRDRGETGGSGHDGGDHGSGDGGGHEH